jgi:hypothetical protein
MKKILLILLLLYGLTANLQAQYDLPTYANADSSIIVCNNLYDFFENIGVPRSPEMMKKRRDGGWYRFTLNYDLNRVKSIKPTFLYINQSNGTSSIFHKYALIKNEECTCRYAKNVNYQQLCLYSTTFYYSADKTKTILLKPCIVKGNNNWRNQGAVLELLVNGKVQHIMIQSVVTIPKP